MNKLLIKAFLMGSSILHDVTTLSQKFDNSLFRYFGLVPSQLTEVRKVLSGKPSILQRLLTCAIVPDKLSLSDLNPRSDLCEFDCHFARNGHKFRQLVGLRQLQVVNLVRRFGEVGVQHIFGTHSSYAFLEEPFDVSQPVQHARTCDFCEGQSLIGNSPLIHPRNPDCTANGTNRADSLHPGCPFARVRRQVVRPGHDKDCQQSRTGRDEKDSVNHRVNIAYRARERSTE